MTSEQCRTARQLLGWTRSQLAAAAGLDESTIRGFEAGRAAKPRSIEAIRAALDKADAERVPIDVQEMQVRTPVT